MKLVKALKQKNRLVGDLKRLQGIILRENSRKVDSKSKVDLVKVTDEYDEICKELIDLKTKIAVATAPIMVSLITMAELKSRKIFYESLNVTEGEVRGRYGVDIVPEQFEAFINQETRDKLLKNLQDNINVHQDAVDEFNAVASI